MISEPFALMVPVIFKYRKLKTAFVIRVAPTGWSKKRGHSTFSQISRKLLKISK